MVRIWCGSTVMMYFFLSCFNPSGTSNSYLKSLYAPHKKKSTVLKWVGQDNAKTCPGFFLSISSFLCFSSLIFLMRSVIFDSSLFSGWEYTKDDPFVQCGKSFSILFSTTLLDPMWLRVSGTMKGGKADGKISSNTEQNKKMSKYFECRRLFPLIFSWRCSIWEGE